MGIRRRRRRTLEQMAKTFDDHRALERHRFLLAAGRALLTMVNLIMVIMITMYVYSAIKNNQMPQTSDMVKLFDSFFSATVKMIGI